MMSSMEHSTFRLLYKNHLNCFLRRKKFVCINKSFQKSSNHLFFKHMCEYSAETAVYFQHPNEKGCVRPTTYPQITLNDLL